MTELILEVRHLVSSFQTEHGAVRAVDGVNFSLSKGKTLGLVGESGSGKSVTSLSLIDLLPKPSGQVIDGQILYRGQDLRRISTKELHRIRGRKISMIFQEPMTSLNPVKTIGRQLAEVFQTHFPQMKAGEVKEHCLQLLQEVGIPSARQRLQEYPHQLSGGMRQRVMIAIALACEPDILIADEPTTALDVTVQAQIIDLMQKLQEKRGMAIIFITHDLGVIAEVAHEVAVMYGGRIIEHGSVEQIFYSAKHPYTKGLLSSIPRLSDPPKSNLRTIEGMVPSLQDMPRGCRFQNRCPYQREICATAPPAAHTVVEGHEVSCYRWQDIAAEEKE
ncbi:MAG: ABC transporter ATP-binding protein [Oligoflexus sp.]